MSEGPCSKVGRRAPSASGVLADGLQSSIPASFGFDPTGIPTMNEHCVLCGLPVSRAPLQQTLEDILARIGQKKSTWVLTLNTEMLARFTREPSYHDILSQADLITADGMPLVWASRFKGADQAIPGRTTGVDLVDAYLRLPAIPAYAVIGGVDPAATLARYGESAVQACRYLFDGRVDLSSGQVQQFADALLEKKVRMLFLALGGARQDQLAFMLRKAVPGLVIAGVGGSFEILGPQGGRAPKWMQNAGLEWLFRLTREPGRLWRRYFVYYPAGLGLLLRDCFKPLAVKSPRH